MARGRYSGVHTKKPTLTALTTALLAAAFTFPAMDDAKAAGTCNTSNLSSTRVKNETCKAAAYAYKQNGKWNQAGDWVGKKKWSSNWYDTCFVHYGVLFTP